MQTEALKKKSLISRFFSDLRYDIRNNKLLLLMSIPGLVFIIMFKYVPIGGLLMAFQDYSLFKGISGSDWVGLNNFIRFFQDPFFSRLIVNTFLLGLYNMLWSFPAPIIFALVLNEIRSQRFKKATQTITYLPYFISIVVIVGIMRSLLSSDGIVNTAIHFFGGNEVDFFNDPKWFRTLYIASDIWKGLGYNSIIYLAAITSVDQEMYEAAYIDGATRFKCMYKITLPCIMPTIAVLFTMRVGAILNIGFEKALLLQTPATYGTSDVISTYVYRMGMLNQDFGYASAIGLFNSIIAIFFLIGGNWISKNVFKEGLW